MYLLTLFKASKEKSNSKLAYKYAQIYAEMEKTNFERSAQNFHSASRREQLRGRALLAQVAYKTLRNTNTSTGLERSFSDMCRGVENKRAKIRNVSES